MLFSKMGFQDSWKTGEKALGKAIGFQDPEETTVPWETVVFSLDEGTHILG